MSPLRLLPLVLLAYAAEAWLACGRLSAFQQQNIPSFLLYDATLTALPFTALAAWRDQQPKTKWLVVLCAVVGSIIGSTTAFPLRSLIII